MLKRDVKKWLMKCTTKMLPATRTIHDAHKYSQRFSSKWYWQVCCECFNYVYIQNPTELCFYQNRHYRAYQCLFEQAAVCNFRLFILNTFSLILTKSIIPSTNARWAAS